MTRTFSRSALLLAGLSFAGPVNAQGLPVFDSSSFGQLVMSVKALGSQVAQLQATYSALTGGRGLGSVLYNPLLKQYLPADWMKVYDTAMAGGYAGISGTLSAIESAERLTGAVADSQAKIVARGQGTAAVDKAVGVQAYAGAQARLAQIESLMGQIDQTNDPKGIEELQARIAIEQAAVQNEATKLELIALLQRAEDRLVEEQKSDLARKIMSASNQGMPPCCSSKLASH